MFTTERIALTIAILVMTGVSVIFLRTIARKSGVLSAEFLVVFLLVVQFAFYPIYVRWFDDWLWDDLMIHYPSKDLADAQVVTIATYGLLMFMLGVTLVWRTLSSTGAPNRIVVRSKPMAITRIELGVVWFGVGGLACVSYLLLYSFFSTFGGIEAFLLVIGAYRSGQYAGTGLSTYPALILLPIGFLYLLSLATYKAKLRTLEYSGLWILFGLTSFPPLLLGFRIYLAVFWLSCLVVLNNRKAWDIRRVFTAALLVMLLFAIYGALREFVEGGGRNELDDYIYASKTVLSPLIRVRAVDVVDQVLAARYEHEWFIWAVPEALLGLLPREFRPVFTISTVRFGDQVMRELIFHRVGLGATNFGGFTPSAIGYALWQGGVLGLSAFMFLFGSYCAYASRLMSQEMRPGLPEVTVALMIAAALHSVESPQDALNTLVFQLLFLATLAFLAKAVTAVLLAGAKTHPQMMVVREPHDSLIEPNTSTARTETLSQSP